MKHMLVIDDEPSLRLMIRAVMRDAGWEVTEAPSAEEGLARLARMREPDVILLDVGLPVMSGLEALPLLRRNHPAIPVVMLTAYGTVGSAVEAMKHGAFDYLTKPADNDELVAVAEKAREHGYLLHENERRQTDTGGPESLGALVGDSAPMRELRSIIAQAGPSEATVLVLGESGTGKELVADALHMVSRRSSHAQVTINCAAIPPHLLESELFGYARGAFTGATKDKPGRFQLANKGTLFLDEIAEMPLALQAKLLRAIQEREIEPLGSIRSQTVDVRIIAATNRDLAKAVQEGTFREDLYFRLNVLEIVAPPLRDHLEDLPALTAALLAKICRKNHKTMRGISPAVLGILCGYHWPGNVRELENVLERAVILSRSDILGPESLPAKLLAATNGNAATPPQGNEGLPSPSLLEDAERDALIQALNGSAGHRQKTAEALGISRRTLQYKLKKFGLTRNFR